MAEEKMHIRQIKDKNGNLMGNIIGRKEEIERFRHEDLRRQLEVDRQRNIDRNRNGR